MTELLDVNTEPVKTAQTNAPGSEPSSWMPLSEEQRNNAPESVRKLMEDKKWNSGEDFATGYADLEKILGRGEHIFKPEDPNNVEAMDEYWQKLGVPSDINEYEFETDDTVPFEDALLGRFKELAKKQHYTKEQASAAVQFQREIIKEVITAEAEADDERVATEEAEKEVNRKALVQRCGGEVAYQNQIIKAREMADALGIFQAAEKLKISKEPEFIAMLMDMDEKMTEGIISKSDEPPFNTKDPKAELKEITESEVFKNKFAPGRRELMKRYMELCTIVGNSDNAPKRVQDG